MPSVSYEEWRTTRARALDEIARGHAAVSGTRRGRRFNTQQFNRAHAVMLAAQFQGFCRDLHSECVDHLVRNIPSPAAIRPLVRDEFTRERQLGRGNAHPSSLGSDFRRLGIQLWDEVKTYTPQAPVLMKRLEELNLWRNAIAHQDFDPHRFGGATNLRLSQVRRWRSACERLARALDEVLRRHMQSLTGTSPW